ncbi:hypothetical protein [Rhodoplanes elegans]|uniref:hypothetical protein n=1 Tax=Rhodoplanes elegans TaxID=29408 RepID=UPI001A933FEA|nr:hypothetical protein [Rhodoplanes elegans]
MVAAISPIAGCGSSPAREPPAVSIPPAPAYLQPVPVLPPRKGESVLAVAEREQTARKRANTIIGAARRDWECLRAGFAGADTGDACEGVK